jgi:hypothetical protein
MIAWSADETASSTSACPSSAQPATKKLNPMAASERLQIEVPSCARRV